MTENEKMAERILEETVRNAEAIEQLLKKVLGYVPEKDRIIAEAVLLRVEKRMFYQDYLFDCHGALASYEGNPEKDIILDYDVYAHTMEVVMLLSS